MLLGFILPFALAFIAIPLESLIHSGRTVGGVFFLAFLRSIAFLLRACSNVARQMSRVLIRLYDVAIVVPLVVERLVKGVRARGPGKLDMDVDLERTHA
jgi:hypothetical protein